MVYSKQHWSNLPNQITPISADRLLHIEDGIGDAHDPAVQDAITATNISTPGSATQAGLSAAVGAEIAGRALVEGAADEMTASFLWGEVTTDYVAATVEDGVSAGSPVIRPVGVDVPRVVAGKIDESFLPESVGLAEVEALIADSGAEQSAALELALAEQSAAVRRSIVPVAELYEDFTVMPDGVAPSRAMTGQVASMASRGSPDFVVISGGALTTGPGSTLGKYRTVELSRTGFRIGARFRFAPWTVTGGVLCLALFVSDIAAHPSIVPMSPMHFLVWPTGWALQVIPAGGVATVVASGAFAVPLVADSAREYDVDILIDRPEGRVIMMLPDGTRHVATHVLSKTAAAFACVEPFRSGTGVGMTTAEVRTWWAHPASAA